MENIPLKSIRIDASTQSRVVLNDDVIAEYAEVLAGGRDLPPVTLFRDDGAVWIGDGHHRVRAYLKADRASIPADVRTGTLRDAVVYSWSANGAHGLRRNNADKRRAVMAALADPEYGSKSLRDIAEVCAVSPEFVRQVKAPKADKPAPKAKVSTVDSAPPPAGVSTVDSPTPPKVSTVDSSAPKTAAEQAAEDAHGDDDTLELLKDTQRELEDAQAQIKAAEADDLKAEAMKWHRLAEVAQRRQNELMVRVNEREAELTKLTNWLRRIGKAVGEDEPSKIPAAVEAVARRVKAVA